MVLSVTKSLFHEKNKHNLHVEKHAFKGQSSFICGAISCLLLMQTSFPLLVKGRMGIFSYGRVADSRWKGYKVHFLYSIFHRNLLRINFIW